MIIIYHAGCMDGFCAAWLLQKAYPNAIFVPASYGQEPPQNVDNQDIIIADFSYKRPILEQLAAKAKSITILDHHKTAEADLKGFDIANVSITFDMTKSGGRLTWEYLKNKFKFDTPFFDRIFAPWLVDYTEDRDLWRFKLDQSKEVNAAIRTYPMTFDFWDTLDNQDLEEILIEGAEIIIEGAAILRAETQEVQRQIKRAFPVKIGDHIVPCVNATTLISEIGHELAQNQPFSAIYFDRPEKDKLVRQFSLRSADNGLDVSEIAKRFGGGGHKHAAAFVLPVPHFELS